MQSRAPFNTTFDEYAGAQAAVPGALLQSGVPCRLVLQSQIKPLGLTISLREAWVTMLGTVVVPVTQRVLLGKVLTLYRTASVLAIPSGSAPVWYVLLGEDVDPDPGDPYFRVWVTSTPPPP